MLRRVPLLCDFGEGRLRGDDDTLAASRFASQFGLLCQGLFLGAASGDVRPSGVDVVRFLATVA